MSEKTLEPAFRFLLDNVMSLNVDKIREAGKQHHGESPEPPSPTWPQRPTSLLDDFPDFPSQALFFSMKLDRVLDKVADDRGGAAELLPVLETSWAGEAHRGESQ